jgi:glycosyltransferase involved in cell wall biosynthesis
MSLLISIITINYNNHEGLKKTIESVNNQTWQQFEYIVIDGGSTDGSKEYIKSKSDKIDYWISEPDKGIYNAMNKGITKATGEYLLFLNSGDHFFKNDVLFEYHKFLVEKDLIYFNLNFIDKEKSWIGKYPRQLTFSHFISDTLPHPATFIKRQLFEQFGLYDERFKVVSDWKFFVECICRFNCTYVRIDETLSTFYTDGFSSDQKNKNLILKERQLILKSEFSSYLEDINQLDKQKEIVSELRKSKKIKLLIKLGLLHKF